MRLSYFLVLLFSLFFKNFAYSQTDELAYEIPLEDKLYNFGGIYLLQWAVYGVSQAETIKEHASMENYLKNPFKTHFDKDHLNWNLGKHTLVGSYYYQFYRSRGYSRIEGFNWAFISSLAFEFTIETLTERPSFQDIYQTPVFGSIVGIGSEKVSEYFHSLNTFPTTVLGYVFNPFTLLPSPDYRVSWQPVRVPNENGNGNGNKNQIGLALTLRKSF